VIIVPEAGTTVRSAQKIVVDPGFVVDPVHGDTPDQPQSPKPPRK
jgi:hypothetical protein